MRHGKPVAWLMPESGDHVLVSAPVRGQSFGCKTVQVELLGKLRDSSAFVPYSELGCWLIGLVLFVSLLTSGSVTPVRTTLGKTNATFGYMSIIDL